MEYILEPLLPIYVGVETNLKQFSELNAVPMARIHSNRDTMHIFRRFLSFSTKDRKPYLIVWFMYSILRSSVLYRLALYIWVEEIKFRDRFFRTLSPNSVSSILKYVNQISCLHSQAIPICSICSPSRIIFTVSYGGIMVSAYIASTSGVAGGNKPRISECINELPCSMASSQNETMGTPANFRGEWKIIQ